MKRIKLTVAYDGTNYCGWQIQPNGITVEEDSGQWNYNRGSPEPGTVEAVAGGYQDHWRKPDRFRGACAWKCGSL